MAVLEAALKQVMEARAAASPKFVRSPYSGRILTGGHKVSGFLFFSGVLLNTLVAIAMPIADIATIVMYFTTHNKTWGILSAIFVGLSWLFEFCYGFVPGVSQLRSRGLSCLNKFMPCLNLVFAGRFVTELDAGVYGCEGHGEAGLTAGGNLFGFLRLALRSGPNLILHVYVLLTTFLSATYENQHFDSLQLLPLCASIVCNAFTLAYFYCLIGNLEIGGAVGLPTLAIPALIRVCAETSRIALLAATYQLWVLLAVFLTGVFIGCANPAARASPRRIVFDTSYYNVFLNWAVIPAVYLAVSFSVGKGNSAHIRGVCDHTSEVGTGDCYSQGVLGAFVAVNVAQFVLALIFAATGRSYLN